MIKHNLISIDLAKNVFQVCRFEGLQNIVFNKKVKRDELIALMANQPISEVAMEACYSSHYWARIFEAQGHNVKLLPAQHVTPFVRGNKSDQNDAIAIAEAARRPNISSVPIKTVYQQDIQCLRRIHERHIAHRTGLMNQARGLLSEYGFVAIHGHAAFRRLLVDAQQPNSTLSPLIKYQLDQIKAEYHLHTEQIDEITEALKAIAKECNLCKLLLTIPGIGVINATAIVSAIGQGKQFKSARELAVWLGLTPKQASSGDRFKSGAITKRGNRYLRKQLVHGARTAISRCRNKNDALSRWANQLIARRGIQKACVAMAARMARIVWVLLHKQENYKVMV